MAFAGPAAVQGDEAERRRQQNTMMDEYLRTAGVGPERQMRIDPATAGASLDRILQNPAIEAPPAVPPHIPAGPRDGPAAIGAAPQFAAEAGSLPPVYTLEHPAFGAGINIRDSPDVEVAKMQMNRQAQLGVLNAMIAADRNQVAGRDVAARLFGAQSQAWADREKLLQGERQRTATGQQFYDKLAADKALAEMTAANNLKLAMVPYGPEANKAALQAGMIAHPENAKAMLDAITKYDNGTLTAPAPGAPHSAVQAGPNYIQRLYHNLGALSPNIATGAGDTWWDRFINTKIGIRPELLGEYENSPYLGPLGVYNQR